MPNGFHGEEVEWERIEQPLRRLDRILDDFGNRHGLTVIRNERNWPDRSFRWGERPKLLIQVFLESETKLFYTMWVSGWDGRSRAEYWKHKTIVRAVSIDEIARQLPDLLERAYATAAEWVAEYRAAG